MEDVETSRRPSLLVLQLELTDRASHPASASAAPVASGLTYCAPFYDRRLQVSDASADFDAEVECRGRRVPGDIFVATVSPQTLAGMAEQQQQQQQQQQSADAQPSTEPKPPALSLAPPAPTIERAFFSGNPSAGLTHGLLHLLKDTGDWGTARPSMLVMLAVPAHMTVVDLAQFVASSGSDLLEMKIIRDRSPGQFMVLLQFVDQAAADRFYSAQHGAPFNSLEPDVTCCLAYVARVDCRSQGGRFPLRDLVELPTCPVCLDRLDEPLRGILTILCNHSFHLRCLDKWHEASCPVCRHVATPPSTDSNRCARCGDSESLWICLICGYVGCGRYNGGHAYEHFTDTSHTFAMEVGTDRVWDYCGDNFVHRLVQNKADGKLVQVGGDAPDDKLDAVTLEYSYLLTSQLESQRLFYEEQLDKQAESLREASLQAEQEREQRLRAIAELEEARRERAALDKRLGLTTSRLQKLQKELDEERGFNTGMSANQRDLQERLQAEQARRLAELRKKDEELEQLREEMRDLYAHLEAGQQLAAQLTQDEAAASQLVVGGEAGASRPAAASSSSSSSAKKRSGRK